MLVRADPGRLPLQDVQGCGRVDGQLQPHRTSEQQAVQHADALQGASSSLVAQELALGWLGGLREVVQGLILLCHLGRRRTKVFILLLNASWLPLHIRVAVII